MKPFATTLPLLTVCLVVGADSVAAQMSLPSLHDEHRSHASGTAWLPETTPLSSVTIHAGAWDVNAHWEAFVQRLDENGTRGGDQISSVNWMMGIGERRLGQGRVAVRGMFSLDSWTIGGCGYPNLLASGELCADEPLYDLQHPHDIFMEVAARYDRPLSHEFAIHVYAGLAGEPAIGPVAYMHRPSAAGNPLAPITHHWFDSSHVSFGVITTGLYRKQWKVEASLFNGREPDAQRSNIDWGPLDSRSARVWWMPTRAIAVQVSGAHLKEAEARPLHEGGGRIDVERLTASMTYHRLRPSGTLWATTIAWGRNVEPLRRTDALLIESALRLGAGHAWFTRYELSAKPSVRPRPPPSRSVCGCTLPNASGELVLRPDGRHRAFDRRGQQNTDRLRPIRESAEGTTHWNRCVRFAERGSQGSRAVRWQQSDARKRPVLELWILASRLPIRIEGGWRPMKPKARFHA